MEDNDRTGATLQDKPYGTIDNHVGSPCANRIYVTWTKFSGLFMGDYSGLAAYANANPLWTDTRNPELFTCPSTSSPQVCSASAQGAPASPLNDQDMYTANLPVPSK